MIINLIHNPIKTIHSNIRININLNSKITNSLILTINNLTINNPTINNLIINNLIIKNPF